jgi:ABC-type transport system involved in cytochrome bd biosynthesis fused ATPase/permease subunit
VLFLAFGLFAAALALTALPTWLRVSAAVAALLCLAKALEPWWRVSALHTVAPLVVLLVLLLVGLRLVGSPRATRTAGYPGQDRTSATPVQTLPAGR